MKRFKLLPVLLLLFGLTGCIQEYTLTEEQSDATAEYMAGKLLEYDADYEQDLISEDELQTITPEEDSSNVSPTAAISEVSTVDTGTEVTKEEETENQKNYSLSEVIGAENLDIQYTGYIVTETYPEDEANAYFSLTPRKGNQLLVVTFDVKNKTNSKKSLNLNKSKILYQLDINVGTVYKPSLTLLENDLQYIDISIAAEDTEEVLLVFEVAKETDLSNINLIVSNDKKTEIIEVK